ncbi:TonB family protein [Spirosoma koreense]
MKWALLCFALLTGSTSLAQDALYQSFEVDSVAEARGGISYFYTFVQANLRKPIAAQASGIGGRVIVEGIVEADGRISTVKVLQKFRPDCDREAVRVFSLFNAWQPAQKNGQAVRQKITRPIMFPKNAPFPYENGARISFFDADNKPVADSSKARFKQMAPVDSTGLPDGDIVLLKRKGTAWKEEFRLPLVRKMNPPRSILEEAIQTIGYQNEDKLWEREVIQLNMEGARLRQEFYQNGRKAGPELVYHKNGALAEKIDDFADRQVITSWYPNGQISQIHTDFKPNPSTSSQPNLVAGVWDDQGHMLVDNGNGQAMYQTKTISRADTTKETQFLEKGLYKDGFKQGVWTGRYADGSYAYEEAYEKGVCQSGKAWSSKSDTLRYDIVEQQPEFQGGMSGLGQFLAQNLRYPPEAQRAGVRGKVFISFVVCTDGTLCDYEVIKGVAPSVDQEALRVVKAMSGRWKPGSQRGEKVRVKYNLPINFSLN